MYVFTVSILLHLTAPQKCPLNITVSYTPVNQELVVQWYPTLPPPPGTLFAYYQVQYRTIGEEGEGLTETVDAGQSRVIINQLENAHNYEVGPYNQPHY